jgi:thioredoxin 2
MTAATLLIPCPHCHTLNRVPASRLDQGHEEGRCGRCSASLLPTSPVILESDSFERLALTGDLPVVVDFWAPWCAPCRSMAPAFASAATALAPRVRLAKLDTEAHPAPAQRYGIRSIPTLILFHQGQALARHSGALGSADIQRWVLQHLPR